MKFTVKAKCLKCPTSPQNSLVDLPTPQSNFIKNHSEIHSEKSENVVKSTLSPLVRLNLHTLVHTPTDPGSKSLCILVISVLVISVELNCEFRCDILEGQNLSHQFHCDFREKTICDISLTNPGHRSPRRRLELSAVPFLNSLNSLS